MHCPVHGDFDIRFDNFMHQRGCLACRGVHSRGYPTAIHERHIYKGLKAPRPVGRPRANIPRVYLMQIGGDYLCIGSTIGSLDDRRETIARGCVYPVTLRAAIECESVSQMRALDRLAKRLWTMGVAPLGTMRDGHADTTHRVNEPLALELLAVIHSVITDRKASGGAV